MVPLRRLGLCLLLLIAYIAIVSAQFMDIQEEFMPILSRPRRNNIVFTNLIRKWQNMDNKRYVINPINV